MNPAIRLTVTLAAISALAAGALALTYDKTRTRIQAQQQEIEKKALGSIFSQGFAAAKPQKITIDGKEINYYAIYRNQNDKLPSYFATVGKGIGYNTSVPVQLLVGFTNPAARDIPEQAGKQGLVIVGWKVIKSEETPGLGERIKDTKPAATWLEGGPFAKSKPGFDSRTHFQKQFAGCTEKDLVLKKDGKADGLDAITAATITSRGIVAALQHALKNIKAATAPEKP